MIRQIKLLLSLSIILHLSCKGAPSSSNKNEEKKHTTRKLYEMNCASCHGFKLEKFNKEKWLYAKNTADIQRIIKEGLPTEGMPSFKGVLTNKEVQELSKFIQDKNLTENKKNKKNSKKASTGTKFKTVEVVSGLEIPWGIEFLPNGDLLIAERKGKLSRFTQQGKLVEITGLPEIRVQGQGGLMDLKLHPNYSKNGWLYISHSYKDSENPKLGNTAVIRAKLKNNKLTQVETIYRGVPTVSTSYHLGSRLAFDMEGYLYISNGDRGRRDEFPQQLNNSNGKIHRLHADGSIPKDNPFYEQEAAIKSIYSYGHRNPQGLAMNPVSKKIWAHEHGPKGGDEVNVIKAGKNYGWPLISFGINYDGSVFTKDTARAGMEQPLTYYVPSIAPCGMAFVTSEKYGDWKNSLLIGSLRFNYLERCILRNGKIIGHEKLLEGIGRVREVKMSPDGYIYIGIENPGRILKLVPYNE